LCRLGAASSAPTDNSPLRPEQQKRWKHFHRFCKKSIEHPSEKFQRPLQKQKSLWRCVAKS
jgi:hypothetical protein